MKEPNRTLARQLCGEALSRGAPLSWFETLYAAAAGDPAAIPWADLEPNPHLVAWHVASGHDFAGQPCLALGCGLGDDCEYLQSAGGAVTGFDISATAIAWCRRRFADSQVQYLVHDVLDAPGDWTRRFAFVFESYTLQVLPPELRAKAIAAIANFVADDGTLLVICRARDASEPVGFMPWPLTREEVDGFSAHGLTLLQWEDFHDSETPPVHRFRAVFRRQVDPVGGDFGRD